MSRPSQPTSLDEPSSSSRLRGGLPSSRVPPQDRFKRFLSRELFSRTDSEGPDFVWEPWADEPATYTFGIELLRWAGIEELVSQLAARHGLEVCLADKDTRLIRADYRFRVSGQLRQLVAFARAMNEALRAYESGKD